MKVLSLAVCTLLSILTLEASSDPRDPNESIRTALQAELEDFSVAGWNRCPPAFSAVATDGPFIPGCGPNLARYRARLVQVAGWKGGPVWHQAGTLPLLRPGRDPETLGVNVFLPSGTPKGTLLLVHGYMSHGANFAYTTWFFVSRGWVVTTLDLPGHGLSTGPRADVQSFADYGDAVQSWLTWEAAQNWPGPRVLVAHSLGAAACLEALRRSATPRPDKVVFCAPLLRTDWFPLLTMGQTLLGWGMGTMPTAFGWDGYLDGYKIPLHWIEALGRWLENLETQGPLALPLTIYSGDNDAIVAEDWNRAELRRLVPRARYILLPGKDHLFLTSTETRGPFHLRLLTDLGLD